MRVITATERFMSENTVLGVPEAANPKVFVAPVLQDLCGL